MRVSDAMIFERIAILGAGLIGASIALAARASSAARVVALYDHDPDVRERARALGLGAVCDDAASAVAGAGLVVLAVPVGAMGAQAAIPPFDEEASGSDWVAFVRQLTNIRAEATKASYASYKMVDAKLGDDLFDAACAAVFALVTRGVLEVAPLIAHRTKTREQLLGMKPALPPARAAA